MATKMMLDHRDVQASATAESTPICHAKLNIAMFPAPSQHRDSQAEKQRFSKRESRYHPVNFSRRTMKM
jgi:hypothetical protein